MVDLNWQKYPVYKSSGVEWLGDIPEHWEVKRLKQLAKNMTAGPFGSSLTKDMYTTTGYKIYGQEQVIPADLSIGDYYISEKKYREMLNYSIAPGDVLVSCVGTFGKVAVVPENAEPGIINPRLIKLTLKKQSIAPNYLGTILSSHAVFEQIKQLSRGGTMGVINIKLLSDILLPLPPLSEQQAIANFLDHKLAQIDEYIAKKQRMIELLKEQRTVIINQAVTKGLNPDVPMKYSGIEWLGEIPEHWEVKKLKYVVPNITVGIVITPAKYYVSAGVPCLRSLNISSGKIDNSDMVFISYESNELHKKSKIYEGDILVVRTGQTGTAAIVTNEYDGINCVDLLIIRKSKLILTNYLYIYINSYGTTYQVLTNSVGAIQSHYNTSTLSKLVVVYPNLEEQDKIVKFIEKKSEKINRAIATIEKEIKLIQEYRTTLISETVTGKIDVTNG